MVWTRLLSLVFGVTIHAVSVVLASFMAGLALGSFVAGRYADRARHPLLVYAALEIGIGLLGVTTLWAIRAITPLYVFLYDIAGDSAAFATFARWLLASAVLIAPTSLMGATLPFIVRASLRILPKTGENLSLLYAVNTAGAAAGTLFTGFVLVGQLGFQASVFIAASMNISAGLVALLLTAVSRRSERRAGLTDAPPPAIDFDARPISPALTKLVLLAMAVSGFCALAYEVVWFRVLDLFLNGTAYAFSIMLCTFLIGLAIGSALSRVVIGRPWNWVAVLGGLQFLIGVQALLGIVAVGRLPDLRDALVSLPLLAPLMERPVFTMAFAAVLVLLPLTVLQGMTFPVGIQAIVQGREKVGEFVGRLNAVNTVGAIIGSLLAGFWLLPAQGSQRALIILAAVNLTLGYVLLWHVLGKNMAQKLAPPFIAVILVFPTFTSDMVSDLYLGIFKDHNLIWYEEGLESTLSVHRHTQGFIALYANTRAQATDSPGALRFHHLLAHMPMLLHPAPRDALVIGLGGGATPGTLARYPGMQVHVVELSPSMLHAAAFFESINAGVLNQPNVDIKVDDGRNHMLLTDDRYDIIQADIIQAHHAGAGNLYSKEYFELAKKTLKDDGLMIQWAERGNTLLYPLIVRTFLDVFPYASVWCDGTIMVGSKFPQSWTLDQLQRRFNQPGVAEVARSGGIGSAEELLAHYSGDKAKFSDYVGPGPILTDDRPLTEYFQHVPHITLPPIQWSAPGNRDNNCPAVFR